MSRPVPPPRPTWHGVWEKEKRTLLLSEFTQWLNWSCSCSNTIVEDTRGNFLNNIAGQLWEMLPSTGNQVRHRAHNWSKISKFVTHSQWGMLKKLPRVSSAYLSLNNKETQSDLTINISSLSRELCRVDFDAMGNALRDMSWSTCEISPGVMGRQSGWRHEQEAIKPAQTRLSLACCVFTSALCETVLVLFGVVCQYWITQKWRASF